MNASTFRNTPYYISNLVLHAVIIGSIIVTTVLGFYSPSSTYVAAGFLMTLFFVLLSVLNQVRSANNKSLMAGIFTYGTQGIVLCDDKGKVVLINPFFEKLFGYGMKELTKAPLDIVLPGVNIN